MPFLIGMSIHIAFELIENTAWGVRAINRYIIDPGWFMWPGGKYVPDTAMNQIGDNLGFAGGWGLAWWLDSVGRRLGWYPID